MQYILELKHTKIENEKSDFEKEQAEAFKQFMKIHFGDKVSSCNVRYSFDEEENT